MKKVIIIGVTGSIGTQALDVIRKSEDIELVGFSVNRNIESLKSLIDEFHPKYVAITDIGGVKKAAEIISTYEDVIFYTGEDALVQLASVGGYDMLLTSVMGLAGLSATLKAIENEKDIALANKETLVGAGKLVMNLAREKGVNILPVDSEHSAIFQCLSGYTNKDIERIILTASGGPFRGRKIEELMDVTVEQALKHPNWTMGKKITVDSATLMNKGLEVIEAKWLFDVDPKSIDVHVHPESIIHSAVEFKDNSVIAQLGNADMRLPIQFALNYPKREKAIADKLDLFKVKSLTFEKPDMITFKCLRLAYDSITDGGLSSLILNTADEIAVELFLQRKISFLEIGNLIEASLDEFRSNIKDPGLEDILEKDREIRKILKLRYA